MLERPMDRKFECREAQDVLERLYVHPFRASLPAWPRPAFRLLRGLTFSVPPAMMDRMSGAAAPSSASLSRMAQASLSTATQSHLLPALRDVPTMYRDVRVPREDRMSGAAVPSSASLSRIPALRDVPTSL